ncbi:MAG: YciI family protein [Caulobacteraceae bacterium]|nr:YciI family protein [Caulobacteraceae bacterium]
MSLYVLMCFDKPGALDLRLATREAHFAYVRGHSIKMRLGGPFLNEAGEMVGSLIFIEADSQAQAQAFSDDDPYTKAGVFERVEIRPWKATFGELP